MENREEIIQQTVKRLQAIQTLDEYKAAREEIFDLMEKVFKSAIDALKTFFENMFTMSPEERGEKSTEFQDDDYLLSPGIIKELERLDQLPGAAEYAQPFGDEMEKRLGPYLEEYTQQMGKVMQAFMGTLMGGMADAIVPEVEEVEEEIEDTWEFDQDNPDTPVMLYDLYAARTPEDLMENQGNLIESLEEQLQSDIWELEVLTDMDPKDYFEGDMDKLTEIRKRWERLVPEMDKEFSRISSLPDAPEDAGKIQKEIMDTLADKITVLNDFLAKMLKRETSSPT